MDVIIAVIPAVISGIITLFGVVISNNRKQGVTDTKIEELTREVREHNNFARRMPVVEEQIKHITDEIGDLKRYHQ